jgi:hypothetical protein
MKCFFILLLLAVFLIGCNNDTISNDYPHPVYIENNINDEFFSDLSNKFERNEGKGGILGEWERRDEYGNYTTYIFSPDGTFLYKTKTIRNDGYGNMIVENDNTSDGQFLLETIENDTIIHRPIRWSGSDSDFQLFVSNQYMAMKKYDGSPVGYALAENDITIKWTHPDAVGINITYFGDEMGQQELSIPINNNEYEKVVSLPINELRWIKVKVHSQKIWKYRDSYYYNGFELAL